MIGLTRTPALAPPQSPPPTHKNPLPQLKTTDLAASDLNKYHKALERALLAFHTGEQNHLESTTSW